MFITSLPLLFSFTHLISQVEFSLFLLAIFGVVYLITPLPTNTSVKTPPTGIYNYLYDSWTGKVLLRQCFWPFFFLVNGIFYYIDYRIMNVTYTIASWKTMHGMILLPSVWWTLSIWRSSSNTRSRLMACAARAITLYFFIDFILRLTLSIKYPELLFDCRLLILEYGDCN